MRQGELGWWTLTRSGAHGLRTIRYWRSQGCAKMMPLFECMHVPEHQLPNQYHPGTLPQSSHVQPMTTSMPKCIPSPSFHACCIHHRKAYSLHLPCSTTS